MKLVQRNVAIREDQDQMLIQEAAKRQAESGKSVSISEVMRDILDKHKANDNGRGE